MREEWRTPTPRTRFEKSGKYKRKITMSSLESADTGQEVSEKSGSELVITGDVYDSRRTPGIPACLRNHGFSVANPQPLDEALVGTVCEWLADAPKILSPDDGRYSYYLKHVAEDAIGTYVPNGVLIAAAIRSGFIVRQDQEPDPYWNGGLPRCYGPNPNAMIAISVRWVNKQIAGLKAKGMWRGGC